MRWWLISLYVLIWLRGAANSSGIFLSVLLVSNFYCLTARCHVINNLLMRELLFVSLQLLLTCDTFIWLLILLFSLFVEISCLIQFQATLTKWKLAITSISINSLNINFVFTYWIRGCIRSSVLVSLETHGSSLT